MAKDREERYQSARAMAAAISEIVAGGEWQVAGAAVTAAEVELIHELEASVDEDLVLAEAGAADEAVEAAAVFDPPVVESMPVIETVIDTPPEIEIDPTPAVEEPAYTGSRQAESRPNEADSGSFKLPGWAWWIGAAAVLILLVFGIRSIFSGNEPNTGTDVDGGESAVVILPSETPTKTAEPPTITNAPPLTNTPLPTNTPTMTPSPTPTIDHRRPPPNPNLGTTWQRPQDEMNMVYVPAGSFMMGSEGGGSDEKPVHEVLLDEFWIDQTEVTNSQYAELLSEAGNQEEGGVTWLYMGGSNDQIEEENGVFVARSEFAEHPVINVTWYGAKAYCEWVDGQLLSEAQWEYAARGPEGRTYPWGEETPTCDQAQFGDCNGQTVSVGSFADGASWNGALDMAGNAWEWVNDWYDSSYYANSPQNNPQGPDDGTSKVLRGGSWPDEFARPAQLLPRLPRSRWQGRHYRVSLLTARPMISCSPVFWISGGV